MSAQFFCNLCVYGMKIAKQLNDCGEIPQCGFFYFI